MRKLLISIFICLSTPAHAGGAAADNVLIYIHPQEYTSQVNLWQYFKDYWFAQGPLLESVAKEVLPASLGSVGMCDATQKTANILLWLQPRMFYNPQVQTFYGKVTAVAYKANGEHIATYVGEANKMGFLDVYPERQIKQVYNQAMQNVAEKMHQDTHFVTELNRQVSADHAGTPCGMVSLFPAPNIRTMSF